LGAPQRRWQRIFSFFMQLRVKPDPADRRGNKTLLLRTV
jgi:hypothetical protein